MASERSAEREDALRGAGYRVTVDGPPGWWWRHLAAGTAWLPPDVAEAYADHLIATGAPSGMSCTDHAAMEADRWVWRHRKWRVTRSSRENAEREDAERERGYWAGYEAARRLQEMREVTRDGE